ncbi:hypothetical protein GC173_11190 [bacterium]|nr:hypothetical protein [bacterium]
MKGTVWLWALMALVLGMLVGCSVNDRTSLYEAVELPRHGEALPPEFWPAYDASPRTSNKEKKSSHASDQGADDDTDLVKMWGVPIPFNLFVKVADVKKSKRTGQDELSILSLRWHDLSVPGLLPSLPFIFNYRMSTYGREKAEPIRALSIWWNPFSTGIRSKGYQEGKIARIGGFPLLFTHLHIPADIRGEKPEHNNNTRISGFLSLHTLGPANLRLETVKPHYRDSTYSLVRLTTPLLLGGVLGPTLWSSFDLRDKNPVSPGKRKSFEISGHGPLFGMAGYMGWRKVTETMGDGAKPARFTRVNARILLFGLLWNDYNKRDEKTGKLLKSRHGPLWTMFGWGSEKGWFRVRLFGIPIG